MNIRAAHVGDVDWLVKTTLAAYSDTFEPMLPGCDWSGLGDAFFRDRFSSQWPHVMIASRQDHDLGFALVTHGNLDMLFVTAEARNSGAGAALLASAERAGARTLECFARNEDARRFYERHGWRVAGSYERLFAGMSCAFVSYAKV